jgi:hypothetical protein
MIPLIPIRLAPTIFFELTSRRRPLADLPSNVGSNSLNRAIPFRPAAMESRVLRLETDHIGLEGSKLSAIKPANLACDNIPFSTPKICR